jgi:hypothetical protein
LIELDRPGVTYDEYYDLEDSRRFCTSGQLHEPASDGYLNGQAPFGVACLAYRIFGSHEVVARTLSVAAGLLSVWATFHLARRFLPRSWSLLAALLLGLSPFFVSASRLAFSHGHIFAVPWLALALRETLRSRSRLDGPTSAATIGGLSGFAAGNDLLAVPWALTLSGLALMRLGPGRRARFLALFASAWLVGLCAGSPMYLANPLQAAGDISRRVAWWDGQREHLWLGAEVATLPAHYYIVVLATKLTAPVVLLLLAAVVWRPRCLTVRVGLVCLWPVLWLSFKGWKSPYYLTPFLPLLFVVATDALRWLVYAMSRTGARRGRTTATATLVLTFQAVSLADSHPDHLMNGIRYGSWAYGGFAGPAVSHGQWVLPALERVRQEARDHDSVVVVPLGYAPRQVDLYVSRLGLTAVHTADRLRHGVHPDRVDYAIVSHDVLAHTEGRRLNGALLKLVADHARFRQIATVRSAGFPTARIWKRVSPHGTDTERPPARSRPR